MWLSFWPDINYNSLDNNEPVSWWKKPYVEQVQAWESNFNKAVWKVNWKLALEWKKLEFPKTIEEQEKEIHELILKTTLKEAIKEWEFNEWIKVIYIDRNVFAVQSNETKNISLYVDKNWEDILSLWYRADVLVDNEDGEFYPSSIKSMKEAWFYCDFKNWKRDLYKILWEKKHWNFVLDDVPLDVFSKEYYDAWKKIIKIDDTLWILIVLKQKWNINKDAIENYLESWALNLYFLLLFEEKWLLETSELFEFWILKMWIKESDVKKALEKWEINKEQALKIYKVLPKEKKDLSK